MKNLPKFCRYSSLLAAGICFLALAQASPLRAQNPPGSLDEGFSAGLNQTSLQLGSGSGIYAVSSAGNGKVYIGGAFATEYNGELLTPFARLNSDGSIDRSYNRPVIESYNTRTDDLITEIDPRYFPLVTSIMPLADGKILIAGNFYFVNGADGFGGLVRLNSDGSVDSGFQPPRFSGTIYALALASNGGYLVAGDFSQVDGRSRNCLVRLKSNGKLDDDFQTGNFAFTAGTVSNVLPVIRAVAVQGDGRLLVGGRFTQIGKTSVLDLARLEKDGSFDRSYAGSTSISAIQGDNTSATNQLATLKLQADSKLLVSLQIVPPRGQSATNSLYRFNSDGTIDLTFNAGGIGTGGSGPVDVIALEGDGKILIGGNFVTYNGQPRNFFTRLQPDGTLDESFNTGRGFDSTVVALGQQDDGKILVGGLFIAFNRVPFVYVARINSVNSAPAVTVTIASTVRRAILGAGKRKGVLTVTRTGGNLTLPLPVYYALSGKAENGVNYRSLSGAVTIPANQTSARIVVRPLEGPVFAARRKVVVALSLASPTGFLNAGYAIGGTGRAFVKIVDNTGE